MPLCKFWPDDGYPCIYAPEICTITDGELICAWEITREREADRAETEWAGKLGHQPNREDE